MELDIASLAQQIADCFPSLPLIVDTLITNCSHNCDECSEIEEFFSGKRWNQVSASEYRRQCAATSLMTQEAFNCFVPGWMTVSILDSRTADVLPCGLISIMGGQSDFCRNRIHEFYTTLSLKQLECVSHFVEWYIAYIDSKADDARIARDRIQHRMAAESSRCDRFAKPPLKNLRIKTFDELQQLSISRLLAYRKKALSLEYKTVESAWVKTHDVDVIWFKEDPRWGVLYGNILYALAMKKSTKSR